MSVYSVRCCSVLKRTLPHSIREQCCQVYARNTHHGLPVKRTPRFCALLRIFVVLYLVCAIVVSARAAGGDSIQRLPLLFESNLGQFPERYAYVVRQHCGLTGIHRSGITLQISQNDGSLPSTLRFTWVSAAPSLFVPEDQLVTKTHYLTAGFNNSRKQKSIINYGKVRQDQVYPGIDLVYYGKDGFLEYDFEIAPGNSPEQIRIRIDGATSIEVDQDGDLLLQAGDAQVVQKKPIAYQLISGRYRPVEGQYRIGPDGLVGFQVGTYDRTKPLTIDPVLEIASYFGGAGQTTADAATKDQEGNLYLAGTTDSTNLPGESTDPAIAIGSKAKTRFIAKISSDLSTVIFVIYLDWVDSAGTGDPQVAIAPDGAIYYSYRTVGSSEPIPVSTPILGASPQRLQDQQRSLIALAKIRPAGDALDWYTAIGCDGVLVLPSMIADSKGRPVLAGSGFCWDYPVTEGVYHSNTIPGESFDAIVLAVEPDGRALSFFSIIGTTDSGDQAYHVVEGGDCDFYVLGMTESSKFPVSPGVVQPSSGGYLDLFLLRLSSDAKTLLASTYFGGDRAERPWGLTWHPDQGVAFAFASESATLVGMGGVPQPEFRGTMDRGVARVTSDLRHLIWTKILPSIWANGILLDKSGDVWFLGTGPMDSRAPISFDTLVRPGNESALLFGKIRFDGMTIEKVNVLFASEAPFKFSQLIEASESSVTIAGPSYLKGRYRPPTTSDQNPTVGQNDTEPYGVYLQRINLTEVTQCELSVPTEPVRAGWEGGVVNIPVNAPPGCPWIAHPNVFYDGEHMVTSNGVGSGSFQVFIPPSTHSGLRINYPIDVNHRQVTVSQDLAQCTKPEVEPSTLQFRADGGQQVVRLKVPHGCGWTNSASSSWIELVSNFDGEWKTGPYSIEVRVANNGFGKRAGDLFIAGIRIPVEQEAGACSATVSPSIVSIPSGGGEFSLTLNTRGENCGWTVSHSMRVALSTLSDGKGTTNIRGKIGANPSNIPMRETLHVAGLDVEFQQDAGDCNASLSDSVFSQDKNGTAIIVSVSAFGSACQWNQRSNVPWLSVATGLNSGTGKLVVNVYSNETGFPRTGTVTLLGKSIQVSQSAIDERSVQLMVNPGVTGYPARVNGESVSALRTLQFKPGDLVTLDADQEYLAEGHLLAVGKRWVDIGSGMLQVSEGLKHSFVMPGQSTYYTLASDFYRGLRVTMTGAGAGCGVSRIAGHPPVRVIDDWYYYPNYVADSSRINIVRLSPIECSGFQFRNWLVDGTSVFSPNLDVMATTERATDVVAQFEPQSSDISLYPSSLALSARRDLGGSWSSSEVEIRMSGSLSTILTASLECLGNELPILLRTSLAPLRVWLEPKPEINNIPPGSYENCGLLIHAEGKSVRELLLPVKLDIAGDPPRAPRMDAIVDAASFRAGNLAVGAIASAFGEFPLDGATHAASLPLPTELDGMSLTLNFSGLHTLCPLLYVSPRQINFLLPENIPVGKAVLNLHRNGNLYTQVTVTITASQPAVFTANSNGQGAPAGQYIQVDNGLQTSGDLFACGEAQGSCLPISVPGNQTVLGETFLGSSGILVARGSGPERRNGSKWR